MDEKFIVSEAEKAEQRARYEENIRNREREAVELRKEEADKPRQRFVEEAMRVGNISEEFANFLWKHRCTHDHAHGEIFVGG